jgi:hypothetical protein
MPRKQKNAPPPPPPEWLAPLEEWMREVRFALTSNGRFVEAEDLRLLMRTRDQEIDRLRHLARVSNKRFDTAEAQHARGDGIARLMRGFLSPAAPAVLPITDSYRAPFKRPPPDRVELLLPALRVEQKRRALLDDLPDDKRRRICAAGNVLFTAYHAHRHETRLERGGPHDLNHPGDIVGIKRVRIRDESKAHALAVAGKTLVAMKAFYGRPRYRLTQSVVRFFTGEGVLYEQLRELWKRLA